VNPENDCSTGVCIPRAYFKNVDKKIPHADFNKISNTQYDIGLLRMADEVEFSGNSMGLPQTTF